MRKILFRGKRLDNGEWEYGNYMGKIDPCNPKDEFWCCFIQNRAISVYEVDPDTVGQYTGLKDKNGVEIFEGDIIQGEGVFSRDKPKHVVRYCEDSVRFVAANIEYENITCSIFPGWIKEFKKRVIGNIHDKSKQSPE